MSSVYRNDRRSAPRGDDRRREVRVGARFDAYLVVDARFLDAEADADQVDPLKLYGYTRDLSASGMGLIVPSIGFDPRSCSGGRPLKIRLMLPAEGAEVRAEAVYCEPLDGREPLSGMRLGTRLHALDERARAFLRSNL